MRMRHATGQKRDSGYKSLFVPMDIQFYFRLERPNGETREYTTQRRQFLRPRDMAATRGDAVALIRSLDMAGWTLVEQTLVYTNTV